MRLTAQQKRMLSRVGDMEPVSVVRLGVDLRSMRTWEALCAKGLVAPMGEVGLFGCNWGLSAEGRRLVGAAALQG